MEHFYLGEQGGDTGSVLPQDVEHYKKGITTVPQSPYCGGRLR